jgi:hypothetical protein
VSDILPRSNPKRVSVVGGWEFVRPFRGETVRQVLSGARGDCRGRIGEIRGIFWDPRCVDQNGNSLWNFVAQNCTKIASNVQKLEPITDGFVHFQLVQKCMNTCTQYMSVNITLPPQEQFLSAQHRDVDTDIGKDILKKGIRGSFHLWVKDDHDLSVTVLQKTHVFGGFGLTPNVIEQSSAKVAMATRFLSLVGSLSLEEQKLCLANQLVHDPESWTVPHFLQLKREYEVLVKDCNTSENVVYAQNNANTIRQYGTSVNLTGTTYLNHLGPI